MTTLLEALPPPPNMALQMPSYAAIQKNLRPVKTPERGPPRATMHSRPSTPKADELKLLPSVEKRDAEEVFKPSLLCLDFLFFRKQTNQKKKKVSVANRILVREERWICWLWKQGSLFFGPFRSRECVIFRLKEEHEKEMEEVTRELKRKLADSESRCRKLVEHLRESVMHFIDHVEVFTRGLFLVHFQDYFNFAHFPLECKS